MSSVRSSSRGKTARPRATASIALTQCAKAYALFAGEEYVRPEHVQALAPSVLAHRVVVDPQAKFSGTSALALVGELLKSVPVPA